MQELKEFLKLHAVNGGRIMQQSLKTARVFNISLWSPDNYRQKSVAVSTLEQGYSKNLKTENLMRNPCSSP